MCFLCLLFSFLFLLSLSQKKIKKSNQMYSQLLSVGKQRFCFLQWTSRIGPMPKSRFPTNKPGIKWNSRSNLKSLSNFCWNSSLAFELSLFIYFSIFWTFFLFWLCLRHILLILIKFIHYIHQENLSHLKYPNSENTRNFR